jgi:hypothetical protein
MMYTFLAIYYGLTSGLDLHSDNAGAVSLANL